MNLALRLDDPTAFVLNYGVDRLRFVSPVYEGDRIRLTGRVTDVRPKNEGYVSTKSCRLEVAGAARPGFVADQRSLLLPKVRAGLSEPQRS